MVLCIHLNHKSDLTLPSLIDNYHASVTYSTLSCISWQRLLFCVQGINLGEGASGSVTKHALDGVAYAVKRVDPRDDFELVQCYLEAQILIALRLPCLIPLNSIGFELNEDLEGGLSVYLVMDFAKGGDLQQYLYREIEHPQYSCTPKQRLSKLVLLRVWREFFGAVKYLHEKGKCVSIHSSSFGKCTQSRVAISCASVKRASVSMHIYTCLHSLAIWVRNLA